MEKNESRKRNEGADDDGGRDRVRRGHPREPNGQEVLSKAKHPIAERFRAGVDGGARACFRSVRGERYAPREQSCSPTPLGSGGACSSIREQSGSERADKCVNGVPKRVHIGHFIGEKFQKV